MAINILTATTSASIVVSLTFLILLSFPRYSQSQVGSVSDADMVQFALNVEFLEAEFFLYGALGKGLDAQMAEGGPPPIGAQKANLDPQFKDIIYQFGLQEVGHIRAIINTVGGFPRPLLNISREVFAELVDKAFGQPLIPPFDPYANTINYLLASYVIPYIGLTGYVGASPNLQNFTIKSLVAGLLAVESGQDAVIRTVLYELRYDKVLPYGITVAEFTNRISNLRNKLGNAGVKDEGLVVPRPQGAEGRVEGNILAGNENSTAYARDSREILRIVYLSGDERVPGGFFPKGADGRIARSYLSA
ncbi:hypothetical protein L6164_036958 [Bauhinia variegata]|uniref:Uncharacterized protein n=1 Tax=Bauhinia variegata TaxID=167791 RepID=A0ACB9KIT3_BAUVA|nr:hypothetical protein L6164_036958 [Bauhinia variegata]